MPIGATIGTRETDKRRGPATRAFDFTVDRHNKVLEYQFDVARWIMASLVVVHGGALVALLNAADRYPALLRVAGPDFVTGLVLALLGGVVVWVNCNLITAAADERLDWDTLDTKSSPLADTMDAWGWRLAWLAVLFTMIALAAFPIGAVAASQIVGGQLS